MASSAKARDRTTSTDTNDTFVTTNNNNNSTNNTLPRTTNLANAVVEKSIVDCGATILDYYDQLLNEVSIHDIPTTTSTRGRKEERKSKVERKRVRFTCGSSCLDEDTTIDDTTLTQEGDSITIIPPPPPTEPSSIDESHTKNDIAAELPTLTQVLDEELDRACFDTLTYFCGDPCGPSSSSNSPSQKKSKHQNKPSNSTSYNPNDITEFLGRGKDPSTYGENPDSLISGSVSWWSSIVSSFDTRTTEDDDTLSTDGGGTLPNQLVGKNDATAGGGACNTVLPEYLVGAVCCGEEDSKPTALSPKQQESLSLPMRLKKSTSFQPVRIHLLYRDRSSASNTSCVEFKTLEHPKGKLGGGKTGGFANVVLKKATSLTRNISFGSRQRSGISLGSRQKSGMPVATSKVEKKGSPSSPSRSVQSTSTKESNSTTASSSDQTPITVKAVDSLGRKETVWKEYIDATTGKVYYSNGIKVSWNRPSGYVVVAKSNNQKKKKDNDMVQSNTTEGGVHKSTLRRLFNVSGGGGKKMDAKKSTSAVADKKKAPAYRQQLDRRGKNSKSKKKKKVWKEYVDASTGKCYYSNGVETTWVKPQQ